MGKLLFVAALLSCCVTGGRGQFFPVDEGVEIPEGFRPLMDFMARCQVEGKVAAYNSRVEGGIRCYSLNTQGPCLPGEVLVADQKIPFSRCAEDTQTFDKFMADCLEKGQVAAHNTKNELQCYNLNTQGPCETGERIVADLETKTRCISYKDSSGAACPPIAVFIAYKGRCRFLGDDCGSCGRRLVVDAFGQGSCSCDESLGFVEWTDGSCQQEGTQGPCQPGEHLLEDSRTGRLDCVFHGCPHNSTKWPTPEDDDLCYRVDCNNCNSPMELREMPGKSLDSVESQEDLPGVLSLQCVEDFDVRGANFGSCVKKGSDGGCLKRSRSKNSGKVAKTKLKSIYN